MLKMDDFVGAGFHRLPDNLIEQHPPEVKWGEKVRMMSAKGRERYLTRVAGIAPGVALIWCYKRYHLCRQSICYGVNH